MVEVEMNPLSYLNISCCLRITNTQQTTLNSENVRSHLKQLSPLSGHNNLL